MDRLEYDWSLDLLNAPHKPGDSEHRLFIGDYNLFTGGLTHSHYMRVAPDPNGNLSRMRTAAFSELCFRP
jgi:hypothetical protein